MPSMPWAVSVPRAAGILLSALSATLALTAEAGAQDGRRDAQAGASIAGRNALPSMLSGDELEAAKLFSEALRDLAEGRRASGQRLLERLVGRFPDTVAADRARRELAGLYAPLARPSVTDRDRMTLGARTVTGTLPPPGVVSGPWRTEVRLSQAMYDNFRVRAGDRIFFADGTIDLGAKSGAVIRGQALWLNHYPAVQITVEGHADDTGGPVDNERLARLRAEAVRDRLIAEGLEQRRIEIRTFGKQRPVAVCAEPACAAQNRRAVTVLRTEPVEN